MNCDYSLWERHQFRPLVMSTVPFQLVFTKERRRLQALEELINEGYPNTRKPFDEKDLIPARVGLLGSSGENQRLECFPISWAEYILMSSDQIRGKIQQPERFFCLAVSILLQTSNAMFILSLRSNEVSHYRGMWHVSAAGYVDLERASSSQSLLPQVHVELEEELGVLPSHLTSLEQLGLCQHTVPNSAVIEASFLARTNLSAEEVCEQAKTAKDSWEGKVHIFSQVEMVEKVNSEEPFNPAGAATINFVLVNQRQT
jgi:hypothetical protein